MLGVLLVRGLYTAVTGALVAQANVDAISNNLANVDTTGFKRELMQVESSDSTMVSRIQTDPTTAGTSASSGRSAVDPVGMLGSGSRVYDTPSSFEQGALAQTGNPLDVALQGPGFFTLQTPQGVRYTRDGGFVRDSQGRLSTANGDLVLGTNKGAITLPNGPVSIDRTGTITSNGVLVGRLQLTQFTNPVALRPQGSNRFVDTGTNNAQASNATTVVQGAQEKSNADVVTSMVGLITNERWFDANEKMIQTQDDEVSNAISKVARTSGT